MFIRNFRTIWNKNSLEKLCLKIKLRTFTDKGLNFVYQLFDNNGNVKSWSGIKEEFGFSTISNFKWQQLIYTLPPSWEKIIKETNNADNLLLPNHHLIKKHNNWY